MIKRTAFLLALTVLWLPRGAQADEIAIGDRITFAPGNGISTTSEIVTVNNDPSTSFVSFCLQADVGDWSDFSTTMYVSGISDYATWQPPDEGGDANGHNPLSSQTAWLYTQFRDGSLTGFDGSPNAVDGLQWAIWQLQNEKWIPSGEDFTDLANSFIALANNAVAGGFSGTGDVRVLNLVYGNGADAQDQLTKVPEAPTLVLLGLGAVAIFSSRRRLVLQPQPIRVSVRS